MTRGGSLWALALGVALIAVIPAEVGARQLQRLEVRRAVVEVDRGLVMLDLRCAASRRSCRGLLRATSYDGAPASFGRQVQLDRRTTRRVALRLRSDGLRAIAESTGPADRIIGARLANGRHELVGDGGMELRLSCRSGRTVVRSDTSRVFRIVGFGVYACQRPNGRPSLLAAEDISLGYDVVANVRIAGRYVAFTSTGGWKCGGSSIVLYDTRTVRVLRSAASSTTYPSGANACEGTTAILRVVLRASGTLVWTEAKGDAGVAALRVLDEQGNRLLDSGRDLDPLTLVAIDSTRIGWIRGGVWHESAVG